MNTTETPQANNKNQNVLQHMHNMQGPHICIIRFFCTIILLRDDFRIS